MLNTEPLRHKDVFPLLREQFPDVPRIVKAQA